MIRRSPFSSPLDGGCKWPSTTLKDSRRIEIESFHQDHQEGSTHEGFVEGEKDGRQ